MTRISLVDIAHKNIAQHLTAGDIAIDATAGNGHDSLFLAEQVGAEGQVYSFDIQQAAIDNTLITLQQASLQDRVTLIQASHQQWRDHVPSDSISAIMFNLGYLPGGDKTITTLSTSTLATLKSMLLVLNPDCGCMTIMAYPGHEQGKQELTAIDNWLLTLDAKQFSSEKITLANTRTLAPELIIIKAITQKC